MLVQWTRDYVPKYVFANVKILIVNLNILFRKHYLCMNEAIFEKENTCLATKQKMIRFVPSISLTGLKCILYKSTKEILLHMKSTRIYFFFMHTNVHFFKIKQIFVCKLILIQHFIWLKMSYYLITSTVICNIYKKLPLIYYTDLFVSLMLCSCNTDYCSSYSSAKTREYTGEFMEGIIQGFYRWI